MNRRFITLTIATYRRKPPHWGYRRPLAEGQISSVAVVRLPILTMSIPGRTARGEYITPDGVMCVTSSVAIMRQAMLRIGPLAPVARKRHNTGRYE